MFRGKRSTIPTKMRWKRETSPKVPTNRLSMNTAADLKKKEIMEAQVETDLLAAF